MRRRVIDDRLVYDGFLRLRCVAFEVDRSDGTTARLDREIVEGRDAAAILPFDPGRGVVALARQFRPPPFLAHQESDLIEACAGLIDPGETPEACALREAREEIGLALVSARFVCRVYPSPGFWTERVSLFLATYDERARVSDGGGLEHEGEDIETLEIPLARALTMIESGEIVDAKTIILLLRLAAERGKA